ncbi:MULTISPECIES: MarR family winged helix-turn-helix transcriptional regulator [Jeotgalicoccus]|uniref:MarR family winged helix-turn-helix transcriptional regulator n=1 Tax=Jeotgalicoccus TaxID=227979 RepID=UPI0004057605|nr:MULTISPECIES: MarR family transcriptional regulator [Jeotgalicoccus]QQD84320.1 MarR family transcriptional regulator [Jeotgalicoccus sp. ATCC 8456]
MDRVEESLKAFVGIKRTNDLLEKSVKKDVRKHGLNISEFAVMELLYNKGPQPINRIQERILIANSSTTYVLDKLQEKGYIVRLRDEHDKRSMKVELTEQGQALIGDIFPSHANLLSSLFDELSDEELSQFRNMLKKISAVAVDK